jgi:hypothetical protein
MARSGLRPLRAEKGRASHPRAFQLTSRLAQEGLFSGELGKAGKTGRVPAMRAGIGLLPSGGVWYRTGGIAFARRSFDASSPAAADRAA